MVYMKCEAADGRILACTGGVRLCLDSYFKPAPIHRPNRHPRLRSARSRFEVLKTSFRE